MSALSILLKQLVGANKVAAPVAKVAKKALPLKSDIAIQDAQRAALGAHLRQMAIDNPHLFKYGKDPISLESIGIDTGLFGGPSGAVVDFGTPRHNPGAFKQWAGDRQGVVFDTLDIGKDIPGSQLYQALWNDVEKSGRVNFSDMLSPVNEIRRTENMLSRGIRDAMEGKPVLGAVWPSKSQAKDLGMSEADFSALHPDEKLGALAQVSRNNLVNDKLGSNYYANFRKNPTLENAQQQAKDLHARLKGFGDDAAMYNSARAFGPSTMMRGSLIDDFMEKGTTSVPDTPIFYKGGGIVKK